MSIIYSINEDTNIHKCAIKDNIFELLCNAKREICIMMFEISDLDIIALLNKLSMRNIDINIVIDAHNTIIIGKLNPKCNICVKKDRLFHHKIILIDGEIVLTGSTNLHTNSLSGRDDEYLININSIDLCVFYKQLYFSYIHKNATEHNNKYVTLDTNNTISDIWVNNSTIIKNIMSIIENATISITIMHFWLTYKPLLDKLIEQSTKIRVNVLVDKRTFEQDRNVFARTNAGNACEYLHINNVNIRIIDSKLFHYKVILIDDIYCIIGSKNLYDHSINTFYDDCILFNSVEIYTSFYNHYCYLINEIPTYCYKEWMLHNYCKNNKINKRDLCIVGSHILEKLYIRKSTDIDFILISKERNRLKLPMCNKSFNKYNEIVSYNWHPTITDNEFISNTSHYTILPNGFKICTLEMLKDKKIKHNREKDKLDVEKITEYMSRVSDSIPIK